MNDEARTALYRTRVIAAQARTVLSKARIAERGVKAAQSPGPIGKKKAIQLAAVGVQLGILNAWYLNLATALQDKEHQEAALRTAIEQAKLTGQHVARVEIYKAFGQQIDDIKLVMGTAMDLKNLATEAYPDIVDLLKLAKLL